MLLSTRLLELVRQRGFVKKGDGVESMYEVGQSAEQTTMVGERDRFRDIVNR